MSLKPPHDWQQGIKKAMLDLLGERDLEERLEDIRVNIMRFEKRWVNGFATDEQEYIEQRL